MAKRPLSVQLHRPSSALHHPCASSHDNGGGGGGGKCSAPRPLSMGDFTERPSDLAVGGHGSSAAVDRRPSELVVGGGSASSSLAPHRRRDRCSPSTCRRPVVLTLPRLDLSLIHGIIRRILNNVTSVGWQVTPCDPIWHMGFPVAVWQVRLRTAISVCLTLLYFINIMIYYANWQHKFKNMHT